MAYKKVEDWKKTPTLDLKRNGEATQSEFLLLSVRQVPSKDYPDQMRTVYSVKYNGKDLNDLVEQFKEEFPDFETDHLMTVWGTSVFDRKMGEAQLGPDGLQTFVEYLGEIPNPKKGRHALYNYDVYFDDGKGETVAPVNTGAKKKAPF